MAVPNVTRSNSPTQPKAQPQPLNGRSAHTSEAEPQRPGLQPEPAKLMPVKAQVYRTIAEMNGGFEQAVQALQSLQGIHFFSSTDLRGMHILLSRMHAQANGQLMAVLTKREAANLDHFQGLGIETGS